MLTLRPGTDRPPLFLLPPAGGLGWCYTSLLADLPPGALLIALDERGDSPTSERFAEMLGEARDRGTPNTVLMIGGPDGHGQELLSRAGHRISFGRLTWPHQIVRILAAEQVYRAVTILSGHPYHRS